MSADPAGAGEVVRLFKARVPQIASGVVTIRGAVRDPGHRTILAVASTDPTTDALGSCVGTRGAVIKAIVAEMRGEHVDIVLWNDSAETFITSLLAPMKCASISLDQASHQARVVLRVDSELLSSTKVKLRSRLLSELTGWVLQFEMER